jgi:anti-sigma-K factor RskA
VSSAPLPHEELEELIAADVLDGLDELGRRRLLQELSRHGPECEECRRLTVEYSEVAGGLAMTLDPAPMSAGAEDRLLRAARGEQPGRRPRRYVAAAAMAAVVALIAGTVGYAVAPRARSEPTDEALAFVSQPGVQVVRFAPRDGQHLAVAFRAGGTGGWVIGSNLSDLPGGKVYELWFQPTGETGVRPAGTFVPTDGTVASPADLRGTFAALAVSVEPPGGSAQPTSEPIFVAPIGA